MMQISGKLVTGVILAVAVAAATFSWLFRWQATRRAAEFWGPEAVALIQQPQRVDALPLRCRTRPKTPVWGLAAKEVPPAVPG